MHKVFGTGTSHTQANVLNGLFFIIESQVSDFYYPSESSKERIIELFRKTINSVPPIAFMEHVVKLEKFIDSANLGILR
jgi:hypothetical protein